MGLTHRKLLQSYDWILLPVLKPESERKNDLSDILSWEGTCAEYEGVYADGTTPEEALAAAHQAVKKLMDAGDVREPFETRPTPDEDPEAVEVWETEGVCLACVAACPCCAHVCDYSDEDRVKREASVLVARALVSLFPWDELENYGFRKRNSKS